MGYDLSVQVPIFSPIIRGSSSTGLRVQPGLTLALVGGDVDIDGGVLTAEQGRIELGSVGSDGQVSLSPIPQGNTFGCVAKTSGSLVEVAKVPTVARPTHLVHEPQAPL